MSHSNFTAWIGRTETVADLLDEAQLKRIAATLGEVPPAPGEPLPALWHWCFFQAPVDEAVLGADGHPARGGFLPPAEHRVRMWAGGRVEFFAPLIAGEPASRNSTILCIEEKTGQAGKLLFVTVCHEYVQHGDVRVREEQDIVFREPAAPKLRSSEAVPAGQWAEQVTASATMLFRYSAVTFNGHRIHYDFPYATEVEGYPGLVVHGPLIATLNLRAFLRANPTRVVRKFAYRGVRPLFSPEPFEVGGRIDAPGTAQLWAGNQAGMAQVADVEFE
ncbi:FAS1-like dehydratase domain-containing protein [Pseudomonas alkylphenolica]|uniref:FAS1-like dehydratase domain-containing protein n=1 Tax=Pseudomonas alkylphenolica TaxID=237609 RepID=UPI0018D71CC2|nr:MaoC family dehydratase N-terminal domain-containing protein [Pseudomonas alkylphenolica]MBH3426202.1 MaoC family dehydratase N-terminal domain-containing protein [Pseudomonas alkylphenolica]